MNVEITMSYEVTYLTLPVKYSQLPANLIGLIGMTIWRIYDALAGANPRGDGTKFVVFVY